MQAELSATRVSRHLKRVVTEKFEQGQLVYKRTKVDEHMVVEHMVLQIKREVDATVDSIVRQIEQQNVALILAPSLRLDTQKTWQEESARHDAELRHEMENLVTSFHPAKADPCEAKGEAKGEAKEPLNDSSRRLHVLTWLAEAQSKATRWRPILKTFAEVAAQVHRNLNAHWNEKLSETTRKFTPTMREGLMDLEAYRIRYEQARKTAQSARSFYDQFGLLAEVELVAKALQQPCTACQADLSYPWALYRYVDTFTILCDVDSREKGKNAWLAVQMLMAGDTQSVMDLLRSAFVAQGGEVRGPVSLDALQDHAPDHYTLWSHDATVRYWAKLKTVDGPLFLPTAVALDLWPNLRSDIMAFIRQEQQTRIEHAYAQTYAQKALNAEEESQV